MGKWYQLPYLVAPLMSIISTRVSTNCQAILFQWHEAIVLDNWQLAELPQSGGREFDPRRVHRDDNLSVPLWVYMRVPVPEHQNQTKQICISPAPRRS